MWPGGQGGACVSKGKSMGDAGYQGAPGEPQPAASETCWCLCGSRAESTGQLATGDKMSPSQLWVSVSMRARVCICEFAPANGEGLQLPGLMCPGSSKWGD